MLQIYKNFIVKKINKVKTFKITRGTNFLSNNDPNRFLLT